MAKNKNNNEELNLNKYQDANNVSLRNMNIGLWLSEKRHLFTRIVISFLIVISAIFFIYSAYQYFTYFNKDSSNSLMLSNNLLSPRSAIKELKIDAPQFFKNDDKYDLVVKITNENDKFGGNFKACFNLESKEFSCVNSFILPSETKYIYALGKDIKEDITTLSFKANNISWQRIDTHAIPNWNNFMADRLNFYFSEVNFYSLNDVNYSSQGGSGNILEFNANNLSAYSYYDIPLNISLFDGSQLISVNTYQLQNFLSGETRNIKINWPGNYRNVRVEITPDLNILDNSVYLKYQGSKTF